MLGLVDLMWWRRGSQSDCLWHSHLICLSSSMKRSQALAFPSECGFRGVPCGWRGLCGCSKELVLCPFLNSCMSSSLLTTASFSFRDSAPLGPNVHCPHQHYERWLTDLFLNLEVLLEDCSKRVSFQDVSPVHDRFLQSRQSQGSRWNGLDISTQFLQ